MMRPWTRLQDYGALIAGVYAALSPIWVSTTGERGAVSALITLGGSAVPMSNRAHQQAIQH